MQRQPIITKDGSHTISVPEMNVTYHSIHGAIQESMHVYIDAGLLYVSNTFKVSDTYIFEMGFGTGLNALLTFIEAEKKQLHINYTAIELFPLQPTEIGSLNYCDQLNREDLRPVFEHFHFCEWEKEISINPFFTFKKLATSIHDLSANQLINKSTNLIYYDAFAPTAQPELWTADIFKGLYAMLSPGGMLVTYCSKGDVRRAMQSAGFIVEKIPGPKWKREMLRGKKSI